MRIRAACRSPAWTYQACAEPGDKLRGRHSWEGAARRVANFCSDLATASTNVCTLQQPQPTHCSLNRGLNRGGVILRTTGKQGDTHVALTSCVYMSGRESRHCRGAATLTATQSVVVHEHLPLPMCEVGFGGFRGLDGLHVAHPGPCHLQQHGVQRLDGPHLRSGCSKRICQRASDRTHLNVGLRHLDAAMC